MQNEWVEVVKLDNGLRVIFDYMPHTETASVGFHIGCGSYTENTEIMGYSHLLEHMVFKGTEKRDFIQINKDIEKYGGYLNAFTDKHNTFFYVKVLADFVLEALDVLADIVFQPVFPKKELEKEKKVIVEEIAMYEDNPEENVMDLFYESIFENSYIGWPILGKKEIILESEKDKIQKYWSTWYNPDNVIVSVSGKFEKEKILEFLSLIQPMRKTEKIEKEPSLFYYRTGYKEKEVEQVHLMAGMETFSLFDKRKYALLVLDSIFGSNSTSRLYLSIREKKGLCYSIQSFIQFEKSTGIFGVLTSTQKKNISQIFESILKEFQNIKEIPVSEEELKIAKAQLKSSLIFNRETVSYRMQKNANSYFWHGQLPDYQKMIREIEKVKKEDIERLYDEVFVKEGKLAAYAVLPYKSGKLFPKELSFQNKEKLEIKS